MKTKMLAERSLHLLFAALLIAAMLTACSGGGVEVSVQGPEINVQPPAQTNEAIKARGAITGLGGVTINGVRYLANNAMVTVNDAPGALSDLRHGQIVTIVGSINSGGQLGTADRIVFDADLIGPVESLDAPARQLVMMGQTVRIDPVALLGAGIDPETFSGLAVGRTISVSGYADAAGMINATWIDPAPANARHQLIGRATNLDLANLSFKINGLTVDYSGSLVIDLPGGAPANGMDVKVIGAMSGGRFVVERLAAAPSLTGSNGLRVQTAGVITRFNSRADFDVNGTAAAVDAATVFLNGNADQLGLNTELVIDGNFASGGRIMADRVTLGHAVNATVMLEYGFRDFTEISVPTVFNVIVTQGAEYSVEVVVDAEASDRIEVTQIGSRLNIALAMANGSIETLDAIITMPVLELMDLTGVVNATLNDFNQSQMELRVDGVSRLTGNGLAIDNLTAEVSGVSQLNLGDIHPIGFADINVSGVSQAILNMDVGATLTGSVNTGQGTGVSTLFYYGTNVALDVTIDGLSSIVRLGETKP